MEVFKISKEKIGMKMKLFEFLKFGLTYGQLTEKKETSKIKNACNKNT